MSENNERNFDLGTVLTITSGRLFTSMDNVYDILNYLSNDKIYTHQIPRVMKIAQSHVLGRYPQLDGVGKDAVINSEQDVKTFIDEQKGIYVDSFGLSPMFDEMYQHIDPIEEAVDMRSGRTR